MGSASDTSMWMNTFEEHGSAILGFLTSRVGRRELAEDLLQETFVRAMRRPELRPDAENIRSYLFTTAHHLIIDQRRRRRPALFSEMGEAARGSLERVADPEARSPEREADLVRLEQRLGQVLAGLRPAHRTAFEQAVLLQKPYAEVAAEQGWTRQQTKINVHRARKHVMERLRGLMDPTPESP